MAVMEANALVNLITRATAFAQQTALGWYKTSQALQLFPLRLAVLRQQSNSWTILLHRYGMSADPFIGPILELATQLLADEERNLQKVQQNCCCRVGRRLFFPESIIQALDSVITAFQTLPEMISQQGERTQLLEKASLNRVARLPFKHDRKYVPFEASIMAVRTALESEGTGPMVVVCGGPGQGKSSMAKYLACLYQDGIEPLHASQGSRQTEVAHIAPGAKLFVDGVFFLRCGKEPDPNSLLLQLWQNLGYPPLPMSAGPGPLSAADGMSFNLQSEAGMHNQLSARLENQTVLIVVDDVWDPTKVEKVLLQQPGIKYLITTQVAGLWTDANCVEIPISLPTPEEANQILANHVKGFPQQATLDIQEQIKLIIEKSASNPLVLANVATNIRAGKASELEEWKSTLRYLSDLQNGDGRRPATLYGRSYSKRTMRASIEMALSSFSREEQTLLLLACVFESQPIPEVVFKILFKIRHSSLAQFSMCCTRMETINFIQIESLTNLRSDIPQRKWSLHSMRQNFISLIKKEEIGLMFSELMEDIENDNIVAILIVLYGQESWRDQAALRLKIPVNQLVGDPSKFGSSRLSSIRTFVWLLHADGEEEWQQKSHHGTKQILEEYLLSGELNQTKISDLLCMQETMSGACEALLQFTIFGKKPLFKESNDHILQTLMMLLHQTKTDAKPYLTELLDLFQNLSFHNQVDAIAIGTYSDAVTRLTELLAEGVNQDIQSHTTMIIGHLSHHDNGNASKFGAYPGTVETLLGLIGEGVAPHLQKGAAWALACLSMNVADNAIKIGSCPGAVEKLVGLLGEGVNPDVQCTAAWALGNLSKHVVANATKIGSYPGAVDRIVALLIKGVSPDIQKNAAWALGSLSLSVVHNATKIGSYPGAVEKLVGLLGVGLNPDVQGSVVWALACLSMNVVDNATKIGSHPHVVERLVGLLGEVVCPDVQGIAAWALESLSKNVVDNATKIGSYPGAVERLVALLEKGVRPDLQKIAASALECLSAHVVDNATKIGCYPGAVDRLVALLGKGVRSDLQNNAASALACLSINVIDNATRIGSHPRVVENLVGLLEEALNPDVQWIAALTLGSLAKNVVDNATKIGSYPGAVERLVALLREGVRPDLQNIGALVLACLSESVVDNATKIGSYPGAVEKLVQLLREGVSPHIQKNGARALACLSMNVVDNATKIGSHPGAVENLVRLLGERVSPGVQWIAALALGSLSKNVVDNATKIGSYPGAVETLVALLGEGVRPDLQNIAALVLACLCENVVDNATKIGSYPGAVEKLVGLLREGVRPNIQEKAAWALGWLSVNVVHNATKIGSFPGVVEKLVALLTDGVRPNVQSEAIWSLGCLSKNVVDNATKIGSYPGVVEKLVGLLGEGESPDIQLKAAWALGCLSMNVVDNATKIGSYPGAMERIVGLLGEGVSPSVQIQAAWALGCLSKNVVDNSTKIGSYPGAVETLVALLGCLSMNEVDNATKIGSYPGVVERLVGLLGEGLKTQKNAAWALWYICCEGAENKRLLRMALSKAPLALDRLIVLTCSEKHAHGLLQDWFALLYEMTNNKSADEVRLYRSSSAYEGKGDATISVGDYKGALEAYGNGLGIEGW